MKHLKTYSVLGIFLFVSFFWGVLPLQAQIPGGSGETEGFATYEPLAPLPIGPGGSNEMPTQLATYLPAMFQFLIGIAGVLAVIMIVIGGIQYMSTDAIYGKTAGKEKITQALGGLLLAMVSWLILYTVNPNILNTNLGGPDTQQSENTPIQTYTFYPKIKTYPQQPGQPAELTICPSQTYTSAEVCNDALEQLVSSVYSMPNYNTYSWGCSTAPCQASSVPNQDWSVRVWLGQSGSGFSECYGGYPTEGACSAAKSEIRANYQPPAPQPPYYNCYPSSQCEEY